MKGLAESDLIIVFHDIGAIGHRFEGYFRLVGLTRAAALLIEHTVEQRQDIIAQGQNGVEPIPPADAPAKALVFANLRKVGTGVLAPRDRE